MLAIRLPAQIEARLTNLAKVTGRTKSFYARQAILQHLDELEDRYVAEQRLTDLKAGRSASASLGDVLNRYGMEDRDLTERITRARQARPPKCQTYPAVPEGSSGAARGSAQHWRSAQGRETGILLEIPSW